MLTFSILYLKKIRYIKIVYDWNLLHRLTGYPLILWHVSCFKNNFYVNDVTYVVSHVNHSQTCNGCGKYNNYIEYN